MTPTTLIPISYTDAENGIHLSSYADTIIYDEKKGEKILCAIRFGGYPEQVEAMSAAIYGGGSIYAQIDSKYVPFKALEKKYEKKVSHDDVYAEATLVVQDDSRKAVNGSIKMYKKGEEKMYNSGIRP